MRTISWAAIGAVIAASLPLSPLAFAGDNYYQNSQQFGMNMPQIALPSNSDEVRAVDGTTCRSAMGSNGAYLDMGVIGTPDSDYSVATASAYGRLVVPLGHTTRRIDCSQLYTLEIQRLKMELQLARMSVSGVSGPTPNSPTWAEQGWSDSASDTDTLY